MKNIILISITLAISSFSFGQGWDWAYGNQIGTVGDEESPRLAVDNADNVFVTATYEGSLTLGDDTYPTPNNGGRDIVVSKYSADGELLWSAVFTGGSGGLVYDITTDESGNAYIVGNLSSNAVAIGESIGNSNNRDFVAQITSSGTLGWITLADDDYLNDKLTSVEVGLDGKVYAAGYSGSDLDHYGFGGVAASGVESFVENETVLIQLSSTGDVQWAQAITGREVRRMAFDQIGHILVSSYATSGGPGNAGHYLTKLNIDLKEEVWVRYAYSNTIGTGRSELGLHIKADGSIVQFMTVGSATVLDYGDGVNSPGGNGNRMGLLWHIGADGVATSVHSMDDQFIDAYTYIEFTAFVALDDENYYLVGELNGEIEMTAGGMLSADPDFIGFAGKDVLVLKVGIDGAISEMATQTGSAHQTGLDMALMSDGSVTICGLFDTPSHPVFGVGTTLFGEDELTSIGEEDVFISRVSTGTNMPDGLTEMNARYNFKLFPNPCMDVLSITFDQSALGDVRVEILDLTGKLIQVASFANTAGFIQIPLDNISPGVYVTRVYTKDAVLESAVAVSQ